MSSIDKKKEIVSKTAELLASSDGVIDITTRRIAENAGVNPAMVNYYFGSKDDLLKAAISELNGDRYTDIPHSQDGSRKAMFDHLVRMCESTIQCSEYGLSKDSVLFSKDAYDTSSKLIEMKRLHDGRMPTTEDAETIFKIVCFLMTAAADPEGFTILSGTDIRVKSQLKLLVSRQLDIVLGDIL